MTDDERPARPDDRPTGGDGPARADEGPGDKPDMTHVLAWQTGYEMFDKETLARVA